MSTNTEDTTQEVADQMGQMGKNLGGAAANTGKKLAAKAAKKVAKKAAKAAAKTTAFIIKSIGTFLFPILIAVVIVVSLFGAVFFIEFDSRPKLQNQQSTLEGMNETDSTGENVVSISDENLIIKAFYINYSNQSYYQRMKGSDELYHVSEKKEIDGHQIVDKHGNEEKFTLSPDLLWTLDEYVFGGEVRFPEAFLRPVYVDENMELKDLHDQETSTTVSSQKYDEQGNIVKGEEEEGIWDYGLAPIITYEKFEETSHYKYQVTTKDVWSEEEQKVIQIKIDSDDKDYATKKVNVDGYPRTVFLIDSISTFMGTAKNKIVFEEKDTGQPAPQLNKVKYDTKVVVKEECETNTFKKLVVTLADGTTKMYDIGSVYFSTTSFEDDLTIVRERGTSVVLDRIKGEFTKEEKTISETTCKEYKETYDLYKYFEGTRYEKIPEYEGETEFGELLGDRYLKQYLELFETHVPEDVMEDFDLARRVKENPEELRKIIEMYEVSRKSSNASLSLNIPAADQDNLLAASKYDSLFIKYADMYGVDPYLLRAMVAQESSGNHEKYVNADRCAAAGCGLMQIEKPGIEVTKATAWRFKDDNGNEVTPYKETVNVCKFGVSSSNCADVRNVEENVKIGAMQLAQRFSVFNYNIMVSIQAYNFGEGGIKKVISLYAADYGKSVDDIIASNTDLGWLNYRAVVSQNPALLGSKYAHYNKYGDPTYLEKIIGYLPANHVITIRNNQGQAVFANAEIEGMTRDENGIVQSIQTGITNAIVSAGKSFASFLFGVWDDLQDIYQTLFTDKIDYLNKKPLTNTTRVKSKLPNQDIDTIITMIMAFEQEDYMSSVTTSAEEQTKLLFNSVFAKPNNSSWQQLEVGPAIQDLDPYFGGNVSSPLKGTENQTIFTSFNQLIGDTYHNGVDVFAPYKANVKAITEGEITEIGTSEDEHIGHYIKISHGQTAGGTVMVSLYGRLDPSSTSGLKVGDKVKKEQKIGVVAEAKDSKEQGLHFELLSNAQSVDPSYLFSSLFSGDVPMTTQGFVAPVNRGRISCYLQCPGYSWGTHDGIDIARTYPDRGSGHLPNILAGNDGVILNVVKQNSGYGNHILIKHNVNGKIYVTLYAHLTSFAPGIQKGITVKAGQLLGLMGDTGVGSGVHLHYGVYENEFKLYEGIDPAPFLPVSSMKVDTLVGNEVQ